MLRAPGSGITCERDKTEGKDVIKVKRAIATLLSFCMTLSILAQGPVAFAEEYNAADTAVQVQAEEIPAAATPETGSEPATQYEEESPAQEAAEEAAVPQQEEQEEADSSAPQNTAGVDVVLLAGMPLQKDVTFTVTLSGAEKYTQQVVLPAAGDTAPAQKEASFRDLPNGTYTLTVSGSGFAAYTQTIEVKDLLYSVQLYTGFLAGYTYASGSVHPGVLRIGDVDGDGAVSQADADALITAIEASDTYADLDGSGIVDLVDLQVLAANLEDDRDARASVQTTVPEGLMSMDKDEATELSGGSLEDLLTGAQAVELRPVSGQDISAENPVTVSFDFEKSAKAPVAMEGMVLQTPPAGESSVSAATVTVQYDQNGETREMEIPITNSVLARFIGAATMQPDGSIVVDFGGQIAVKKVTIKVTAVSGGSLAEISKVEFLNDMESRIPPPTMDIPEGLAAVAESQAFTLTWNPAVNVTGYEIMISLGEQTETVRTTANSLNVTTFGGAKLKNGSTYTVQVQSVNGEWRSGYGEAITVTPKADKLPPAPDALVLTGRFQRIEASWADMKDTNSYNLYYRKQGDADFIKVEVGAKTGYTIQNLENNTRYEVYVTGVNELGEGPASLTSTTVTSNVNPVKMPAYKLINTPGAAGEVTAHITSATHEAGYMKDSPLDSGKTAWGAVDNDFTSWYGLDDWDDGATYPDAGGLRVTFDDTYKIGSISLTQIEDRGSYGAVIVYARGEDGREYKVPGVSLVKHSDGSRSYYTIKIAGGVTTDYLRVCVGYTYWNSPVSIAEIRFYAYDSLEDDILALYADDLHVTLRDDVDESTIEELQTRLDTPDEVSGELHPERQALQR